MYTLQWNDEEKMKLEDAGWWSSRMQQDWSSSLFTRDKLSWSKGLVFYGDKRLTVWFRVLGVFERMEKLWRNNLSYYNERNTKLVIFLFLFSFSPSPLNEKSLKFYIWRDWQTWLGLNDSLVDLCFWFLKWSWKWDVFKFIMTLWSPFQSNKAS